MKDYNTQWCNNNLLMASRHSRLFEYTLAHVEGSNGIDVKDPLHSIGTDLLSCGQEVACRPVDQDIDLSKLVHDVLHSSSAALNLGNISLFPMTLRSNLLRHCLQLVF